MIIREKANELLEQLFAGKTYSVSNGSLKTEPVYYYLGLHNGATAPAADGSGFEEPQLPAGTYNEDGELVTVNEYRRVRVHNSEDGKLMEEAAKGMIKNNQVIMFQEAENYAWGQITHFGVFETKDASTPIFVGELTTPITVDKGYIPIFRTGKLKVGLDQDPANPATP